MSKPSLKRRIQEFRQAKDEWERAKHTYQKEKIICEAAEKLKKLEEGPASIGCPRGEG